VRKKDAVKIIETHGGQVFSVPNSLSGREFIRLLRVYLNANFAMRTRGRAKNRKAKGGDGQDTPRGTADWLAVYIEGKNPMDISDRLRESFKQGHMSGVNMAINNEKDALRHRLAILNSELDGGTPL
jgi:hypothetical protein